MTYNKNNFAVAKAASRSGIRAEMACVAFYGDRTVATDSFSLIEMSATGKKKETPVLYYADDLKKVKMLKDTTFNDDKMPIPQAPVHGDVYPKVDVALNGFESGEFTEIVVNAAFLENILSVMKRVDSKYGNVTLRVPQQHNRPIIITAQNKKDGEVTQKARAFLMPVVKK